MANYVYSTASCDNQYAHYEETGGQLPALKFVVKVAGKANITDKHFVTPKGVVTELQDWEAEFLERDPTFQQQVEAGFMKLEKRKKDPEKVAEEMTKRDRSAPVSADRFQFDKANNTYTLGA